MLGGMAPVTQLVAMIRSTPARNAVGLLAGTPADRMPHVVAALTPRDIARLLPAMRPEQRESLTVLLSAEQVIGLIELMPTAQAVTLLTSLPVERMPAVCGPLSDQLVLALLAAELPTDRREAVQAAVNPRQLRMALSVEYERDVVAALGRTNVEITVPQDAPAGTLMVRALGRHISVAIRYGDDGRMAVRDAEAVAYRIRAAGALAVTNEQPAEDVLRYCHDTRLQGRQIGAIAWVDGRHDGLLKRALVSLVQGP